MELFYEFINEGNDKDNNDWFFILMFTINIFFLINNYKDNLC
jgi:hypothetical protein